MGYFANNDSDGELHQLTWPPQSPYLNQIEMFWDESDRRVKEKQMWELLQDLVNTPGEAG
jgi:hypothetical protein